MSDPSPPTAARARLRGIIDDDRPAVLVGAAVLVAAGVVTLATRETYDDPWILYRYAENLASGAGWTFNPGVSEANAVTSPLMVLLLAAQLSLGAPMSVASSIIFLVGTWTAAFFGFLTLRAARGPLAGVVGAALVVSSPFLASLRGMESALLLGATAVAVWAAAADRRLTTGVALGLAVLARPDSLVLAGCVLGFALLTRRRVPLRETAALSAVLLPWAAYSLVTFHTVLPSTLAAKQAQRRSGAWAGLSGDIIATVLAHGHVVELFLTVALATVGAVLVVARRVRAVVPLIVASAMTFLAYEYVLQVAGYPWYAATLFYTVLLLAALGVDALATRSPALRVTTLALACALIVLGASDPYRMSPERRDDAAVAHWLRGVADPGSTIATAEIGRIGYLSGTRTVDYLGLLDPSAAPHLESGDWAWWVGASRPDYWVTTSQHRWVVESTVLRSPRFRDEYQLVHRTPYHEIYARQPG